MMMNCLLALALVIGLTIVISDNGEYNYFKPGAVLTKERFEVFKNKIIFVIDSDNCNQLDPDITCPGLVLKHPDVTILDTLGSPIVRNPVLAALLRLSFHDCAGIEENKVRSGNNRFFTDGSLNAITGGCNGCIGISNPSNNNLLDSAILPVEAICNEFRDDGMSRADCWALGATVAVEYSVSIIFQIAAPPFFVTAEPGLFPGDIPLYYGRAECENSYDPEHPHASYPFDNPAGVEFNFPDASLGWEEVTSFFKSKFSWNNDDTYFTNKDIIALMGMAHSIGMAHQKVSGYSGQWDFSRSMDAVFLSSLFNEDPVNDAVGLNSNWNHNSENGSKQPGELSHFNVCYPPSLIARFRLDLLGKTCGNLAFNTDIAMVFDISYYIENGMKENIDCNTDAKSICAEGAFILTGPRGETGLNGKHFNQQDFEEYTECPAGQTCCEFIQCPFQCEGGYKEFRRIIDGELYDELDDNTKCPAATAHRYSMEGKRDDTVKGANKELNKDFVKAFKKMITIGYVDKHDDSTVFLERVE